MHDTIIKAGRHIGSYDVVGDIAIVVVPDHLVGRERIIAHEILQSNSKIKVVAKRTGLYGGEFRTVSLQVLAGEKRLETELREFGVRLRLNVETVYFSVRSGHERKRIASLVKKGESVLVLFSGIAPFPLLISRYAEAPLIVGVEKNPVAHHYALENLRINKNTGNIRLVLGDVAEVLPTMNTQYDRVVMPLPTAGEQYLPYALQALKPLGTLHFYDMQHPQSFSSSRHMIARVCREKGRNMVSAAIVKAGHCGPKSFRICVDATIA